MGYKAKRNTLLGFFAKRNGGSIFLVIVFGLLANGILILIPISIGKYYSLLFQGTSRRGAILDVFPEAWVGKLPNFLYFFFALIFVWMVATFMQRFLTAKLGEVLVRDLREKLFAHQLAVQMKTYDATGFGKYLLRYSGDMNSIKRFLTAGIIRFSIDFLLIVMAIVAMLLTNVFLTLIIAAGIGLILIIVFFLNRVIYKISLELRNKKSGLLSFVSSRLPALLTIKMLNRGQVEVNAFNKRSKKIYALGVRYQLVNNAISAAIPGVLYATIGVLLCVIYWCQAYENQIQGDHLLSFILLFITVQPVFRRVLKTPSQWKLGNISFEKYFNVLQLPTEKTEQEAREFIFKRGKIVFKNVSFSYADDGNVLSNLNFTITGGTTTMLRMGSGLPKSTLIKLITGVYTPTQGSILIDGQKLDQRDFKHIRRSIAVLSEDIPLLGRTVFEACSYSKSRSKRKRTEEVLNALQKELPEELKMTLDQKIGERGEKLNVVQKQLLIATRCFLVNKPIVLIESISKMENNPAFQEVIQGISELQHANKTIVFFEDQPCEQVVNLIKEHHEI